MSLLYPGQWKFEGSGIGIPMEASSEFYKLVVQIADGKQNVVEEFKRAFGGSGESSAYGWALSDMDDLFEEKLNNAALFIDCFWSGIERASNLGAVVPEEITINKVLDKYNVSLRIQYPNLVKVTNGIIDPVALSQHESSAQGYELKEELGKGGFGVVYRAIKETKVSSFEFALKILDPSPFVENYEKALKRFSREVVALQSLQHRSVVQIIEGGLTGDNKPYIVMPLIEGKNIRDTIVGMSYPKIISLFIEVLSGLQHAHDKDVIHRDLKPNNILVRDSDSQPIILDFGAAFVLDQQTSESLTTHFTGTMGYIPSEVLADPKRRSSLHDIYSCGIMLYECVARRIPDPANYRPLSELDDKYRDLDNIIQNAISGEKARTKSAQIMIAELENLL